MTTIREIVEDALKNIEELGEGQSMTAQQGQDGLRSLVDMIDSWSIEAGMVHTETVETFTLTGNDNSYTIGSGGDFNTTRPLRIIAATISDGGFSRNVKVIGAADYAARYDDDDVGEPDSVYYDGNSPLGTLRFYPTPTMAYTVTLYTEKALTSYSSLNDALVAPQGWNRGLKSNLAIEIAPQYGKTPKQSLVNMAMESKRSIKNQNLQNDLEVSRVDNALVGGGVFNIYSGDV